MELGCGMHNWSYFWIGEQGTTAQQSSNALKRMFHLAAAISGHKFFTVQNLSFGLQMPAGTLSLSLSLLSELRSSLLRLSYLILLLSSLHQLARHLPYLCTAHLIALHENLLQNGQSLNGYCPLSMTVNLTLYHRILTWIC